MAEDGTAVQEQRTAREMQAGFSFLAEASRLLAGSLDYENALATVADLSLPYFGAWCIVDIVELRCTCLRAQS